MASVRQTLCAKTNLHPVLRAAIVQRVLQHTRIAVYLSYKISRRSRVYYSADAIVSGR